MRLSCVLWALAVALLPVAAIVVAQPRSATPPPRRVARSPLDAVRGFLSSYLAVSYGRALPRTLRNATPDLRGGLERNPPHANDASASSRPQVVTLDARPSAGGRAVAVATI